MVVAAVVAGAADAVAVGVARGLVVEELDRDSRGEARPAASSSYAHRERSWAGVADLGSLAECSSSYQVVCFGTLRRPSQGYHLEYLQLAMSPAGSALEVEEAPFC